MSTLATTRGTATPYDEQLPVSFVLLADVGAMWEDRVASRSWPPVAVAAADQLMALLSNDKQTSRALADHTGRCVLAIFRLAGFPADRAVRSFSKLTQNLKPLVLKAIATKDSAATHGLLLGKPDSQHGQLVADIVLLSDRETALDRCRQLLADDSQTPHTQRTNAIRELLERPPARDYDQLVAELRLLGELTRNEIGARLAGAINAKIANVRQESLADKQTLATWVNSELRMLGLAIKCPKTGRPGILIVDVGGSSGDVARFRVESVDEQGRRVRKAASRYLDHLEIIADDPRGEGAAKPRSPRQR